MNLIQYIGLDVHNDSIALSLAPSDSMEVRPAGPKVWAATDPPASQPGCFVLNLPWGMVD